MSGSGHHRRLGTPATTVKAQLRSRWSGGPDHGHPGTVAEEKPPCCETFPLDTGTREDDTPEALKRFLHQIAPEPDPEPDPVHDHLFQRHLNRGHLMDRIKMADSSPSAKTSRRSSLAETGSQVSISPTFYEQLFHTKVFCEAFLYLQFGFCSFLAKEYWCKS